MAEGTPAGRIVRSGKKARTQVVRVFSRDDGRPTRWCEAVEEAFLAELAATCNVRAAAATVGFAPSAIYLRRSKFPAFAAQWDAAIASGYARLEARLVELATDSLRAPGDLDQSDDAESDEAGEEGDATSEGACPIGPRMTVAEAIHVLRLHRGTVKAEGPQRWRRGAPDRDAMQASILRKIEAIRRGRGLPEPLDEDEPGDPA